VFMPSNKVLVEVEIFIGALGNASKTIDIQLTLE
jgi:hypothetical protein